MGAALGVAALEDAFGVAARGRTCHASHGQTSLHEATWALQQRANNIYVYIYTHIHLYTHVYAHVCVYVYIYIYVYICMQLHIYIYTHTHTCIARYLYIYICVCGLTILHNLLLRNFDRATPVFTCGGLASAQPAESHKRQSQLTSTPAIFAPYCNPRGVVAMR